MKSFKRLKFPEAYDQRAIQNLQENIREFLDYLITNPLLDGTMLQEVSIGTGNTEINHRLERKPLGYIIVYQSASAIIWQPVESTNEKITLIASSSVTVNLWVF